MKRILTIDWDFFFNADFDTRDRIFLQGEDFAQSEADHKFQIRAWEKMYLNHSDLIEMGVKEDDYSSFSHWLTNYTGKYSISEGHEKVIDEILKITSPDEEILVYNVDFHHDLYAYGTGSLKYDCSNWVLALKEMRPKLKYVWVYDETSQFSALYSENAILDNKFTEAERVNTFYERFSRVSIPIDFVHLCKSELWSPPHLDLRFNDLARCLTKAPPATINERWHEVLDFMTTVPGVPGWRDKEMI